MIAGLAVSSLGGTIASLDLADSKNVFFLGTLVKKAAGLFFLLVLSKPLLL